MKLPTMPIRSPATARKKYTPATVVDETVDGDVFLLLFTSPQYSQMLSPVMRVNRKIMALG